MKKILTMAMMLMIVTSAMAQFKFSGVMRVRGNVNNIATYPNYDKKTFPWIQVYTANATGYSSWSALTDSTSFYTTGILDSLLNSDNLATEKFMDMRFRPTIEYRVNDNLNTVWTAEIGDVTFGKDKSGAQGADGINVETKNLYFDWSFYPGQKIRAGIQNYMDPMVMIVEDDFAGITMENNWDFAFLPEMNTKIGWLRGRYDGNGRTVNGTTTILSAVDGDTYDYGYSNYIFDCSYDLNKNNKVGINMLYQNYTEDVSKAGNAALFNDRIFKKISVNLVNYNKNEVWIAPYFKGRPTYDLSLEAEFVFNLRNAEFDVVRGELRDTVQLDDGTFKYAKDMEFLKSPFYLEDGSGFAFMGKANYKITSDLDVGLNMLFASGQELSADKDSILTTVNTSSTQTSNEGELKSYKYPKMPTDYYHGASMHTKANSWEYTTFSKVSTTGLEILGTNGVCDGRGLDPALFGDYFGTILPVLYANYKITPNYSIGMAFGSAMTAVEINYKTFKQEIVNNLATVKQNTENRSRNIGTEFDVNGNLTFDKLSIKPVAAFFFPGDLMQVPSKTIRSAGSVVVAETEKMGMMYEIGLKAEYKF